jgi:hypothetical protein
MMRRAVPRDMNRRGRNASRFQLIGIRAPEVEAPVIRAIILEPRPDDSLQSSQ